jgi:hypothetical protein
VPRPCPDFCQDRACPYLGQDQRRRIWGLRQAKVRGVVCGNHRAVQEPGIDEVRMVPATHRRW